MEFNFNGHLYELTFEDKPVLKENGLLISNKTLSVLREYINANSINILLFNRNGKPKNTYSIVRELLTYNSKLVSKRKKEMKSSFGLNNPKKIKLTKLKKKEALDFGELNNKPKLLIIACSDSKVDGGAINNEQNYFLQCNTNACFKDLIMKRAERMIQYNSQLKANNKYFIKNGKNRSRYYTKRVKNEKLIPAYLRYSGKFYSQELRDLYLEKNQNANLHIIIVSGLYGLLEFQDSIINYQLGISKFKSVWEKNGNVLTDCIVNYIKSRNISGEDVFYAVSPSTYLERLNPMPEWNNLWIAGGRGANAAKHVLKFLRKINNLPHSI